jgi:sugar phosphate isomerase/epimerase
VAEILQIGISTTFNYNIPFESMVKIVREAGFTALSLGGGNVAHSGYSKPQKRRRIKAVLRRHEVMLDSIHAPFGKDKDISSSDSQIRSRGCNEVESALDACNDLGASVAIVHLNSRFPASEHEKRQLAVNRSLEWLIPRAERLGLGVAVENLPGASGMRLFEDVLALYSQLEVCYDSSHAYLNRQDVPGGPFGVLDKYGDRVLAVHLSDASRDVDDHLLPYTGKIDWEDFAIHFSKTAYRGTLLLEVEMRTSRYEDPVIFLHKAHEGAVRLSGSIEEKRE